MIVVGMTVKDLLRFRRPRVLTQSYDARGMSLWTDIADWVGGYPFEVASTGQIIGFYQQRGFRLDHLLACGKKLGCNQYVFTKIQPT
jgi:2-polyprenyl-6-hydroxyphenyl methylase/3-demethylubiquinone-9 3-methyltransferase